MNLRKSFQLQVEQLESRDAPAVLWSMNIGKGKSPVSLQVTDTGLYQIGSGKIFTVVQPGDARIANALRSAGLSLASLPCFTTTSLMSTGPSVYGDAVSFTVTVKSKIPTFGSPTGTVRFFVDGVAFGDPVALVGGKATSGPISTLSAGSHNVTATFTSSQLKFLTSTASLTQTVAQRSITVTADAQSKVYGESDPALTYAVSGSLVSGDSFSGALSRASGDNVGSYAIGKGTLSLSANYLLNFVDSVLTVSPASTATDLTVSSNSVNVGDLVTFAATVSGTTAGSVQFVVDGVNFDEPVALDGDTAYLTTTLGAGIHTVSAVFVPDNGNFTGSVSTEAIIEVQEDAPQPEPEPLTFTAISGNVGFVGLPHTFQIVAPDGVVGPFNYVITFGPADMVFYGDQPQVLEFTYVFETPGTYHPTVTIFDATFTTSYEVAFAGELLIDFSRE